LTLLAPLMVLSKLQQQWLPDDLVGVADIELFEIAY
jgi:hypothetical protein